MLDAGLLYVYFIRICNFAHETYEKTRKAFLVYFVCWVGQEVICEIKN